MAAIGLPNAEPWVVARWAFKDLLSRACEHLQGRDDLVSHLTAAQALDGLHMPNLSDDDARTVAVALYRAADDLIPIESVKTDPLSRSWVAGLVELQGYLDAAYGVKGATP